MAVSRPIFFGFGSGRAPQDARPGDRRCRSRGRAPRHRVEGLGRPVRRGTNARRLSDRRRGRTSRRSSRAWRPSCITAARARRRWPRWPARRRSSCRRSTTSTTSPAGCRTWALVSRTRRGHERGVVDGGARAGAAARRSPPARTSVGCAASGAWMAVESRGRGLVARFFGVVLREADRALELLEVIAAVALAAGELRERGAHRHDRDVQHRQRIHGDLVADRLELARAAAAASCPPRSGWPSSGRPRPGSNAASPRRRAAPRGR